MVAVSYFVSSWLLMTLICVALIAAIYFLMKRGY
jgi:4-hydroxybenzoate polyprenyltransferase